MLFRSITHHRRRRSRARTSHARACRATTPSAARVCAYRPQIIESAVEILQDGVAGSPRRRHRGGGRRRRRRRRREFSREMLRRVPSSTSFVVSRTIERWSDRVSVGRTPPPHPRSLASPRARRRAETRTRAYSRASERDHSRVRRARVSIVSSIVDAFPRPICRRRRHSKSARRV